MKAVILAAGKGTRMGDLTLNTPKPMLAVNGKPLLAHKIDAMPLEIEEVVLIIGYLGHKIKEYFGESYGGRTISYFEVLDLNGTGGNLHQAKELLGGRFLVLMGDDIYSADDMAEIIKYDWAVLGKRASDGEKGDRWLIEDNKLKGMYYAAIEGADEYMNTGMYMLDHRFFDYPLAKVPNKENEWGLPQTIVTAVNDIDIAIVKTDYWIQVTSQDDLRIAEMLLAKPQAEVVDLK